MSFTVLNFIQVSGITSGNKLILIFYMISSQVKISRLITFLFYPLTALKFAIFRSSLVVFGNLQKMFGNVREMLGNICLAFGTILENLWESSEVVGNFRKISNNNNK